MDAKISGLNCEYSPPKCGQHVLEPVQVHVFFRHGDRSPIPIYNVSMDSDLWASRVQERPPELPGRMDYKFQEFPWGQLTRKGKEQALGLGQWVRKHYLDVQRIPEDLPSSIHFRSTNYERTHLTGWYVLNGLLDSSEAAASVPLEMRGKKDETLADTGQNRRVSTIVKEHMDVAVKAVKQPDGTFKPSEISILFEKMKVGIARFLGVEPDAAFSWSILVLALDVLNCGVEHGDPLPESILPADFNALKRVTQNHLMTAFKDKRFMRFGMGRLMREIVEANTQPKPSASSTERVPSLYIYAGHDTTILPLSVVLGAPMKEWPDYCSNIIIELLKSTDLSQQYFIRVLYNGKEQPLALFSSPNETKTILTLDEFLEQASYSMITEEEFQNFCQGIESVSSNFFDDMQIEQVTEA